MSYVEACTLRKKYDINCPQIIDMVWRYRSPIPVGRREVFYSFKLFLPAFAVLERGGGEAAPCGSNFELFAAIFTCVCANDRIVINSLNISEIYIFTIFTVFAVNILRKSLLFYNIILR
jgi:hypothetical protein